MALLGILAAFLVYRYSARDNLFPKNFGTVDAGKVYRAGRLTPAAFEQLRERYGIRTIIDLGGNEPGSDAERREERTAEAMGARRVVLRLGGDGTGNPNNYVAALRIMNDPAQQPVLVHCSAGSERTGCAVAFYRQIVQGRDQAAALAETTLYRHDDRRNPHVREIVQQWTEPIARTLREGGWLAGLETPPGR
jgi:protein tyrosine/serine phosphatase